MKSDQNPQKVLSPSLGDPSRIYQKIHRISYQNTSEILLEYVGHPIRIQRDSYWNPWEILSESTGDPIRSHRKTPENPYDIASEYIGDPIRIQ